MKIENRYINLKKKNSCKRHVFIFWNLGCDGKRSLSHTSAPQAGGGRVHSSQKEACLNAKIGKCPLETLKDRRREDVLPEWGKKGGQDEASQEAGSDLHSKSAGTCERKE